MDSGFGRSQVYKLQPWKTNCSGKLAEAKIFLSGDFNVFLELSFEALGKAQVQGRTNVLLTVPIICSLKKLYKLGKFFQCHPVDQWLIDYHRHEITHEVKSYLIRDMALHQPYYTPLYQVFIEHLQPVLGAFLVH